MVRNAQDAADILSRATLSPLEITASAPPITLSAVPPAASWSVPISVGVDQLRPYTAYLFEVSAFTSDGEGQIASTMVRMPESGMVMRKGSGGCVRFKVTFNIRLFCEPLITVCFSPGGPATELFHTKYDVQIDLSLLELPHHYHREIHLHALPLRPQR